MNCRENRLILHQGGRQGGMEGTRAKPGQVLSCVIIGRTLPIQGIYANATMAERGGGGLDWVVESTTVTHSSADWWDILLPLA